MIKTNGAQNGRSGTYEPRKPTPARPIKTAAIQHDSIAPSRLGSRNSPRLVISSVSGESNIFRRSHCAGDRTLPCFFCGDLGGSICKGFMGSALPCATRVIKRSHLARWRACSPVLAVGGVLIDV